MSSEVEIEQRLKAVEAAVIELRRWLALPSSPDWLRRIADSMKDESAFGEMVALGRAYRVVDRPSRNEGEPTITEPTINPVIPLVDGFKSSTRTGL